MYHTIHTLESRTPFHYDFGDQQQALYHVPDARQATLALASFL